MTSVDKKKRMWEISSGLHKKTLVFFSVLIFLASLLSIVAIYHHSRGEAVLDTIVTMAGKAGAESETLLNDEGKARDHVDLESGLTVMTLILVSAMLLFMVFFIRNIIIPLGKLERMTRDMADGRLDRLVHDDGKAGCSIGIIGENVNSLAMNLQEVLLLVWNLSEHNLKTVDEAITTLEKPEGISREEVVDRLQRLKAELEQMQGLTGQFEFFDVALRDRKAVAKEVN
jgi:hypothetical protein